MNGNRGKSTRMEQWRVSIGFMSGNATSAVTIVKIVYQDSNGMRRMEALGQTKAGGVSDQCHLAVCPTVSLTALSWTTLLRDGISTQKHGILHCSVYNAPKHGSIRDVEADATFC